MSKLFSLNMLDAGKAILVAFLTSFIGAFYAILQTGRFPTSPELGAAALAGVSAAIAYLMKNFFTNSTNQLAKPETKQ